MLDVKERPSRSDLTTDITGAYDGSCMVDALSASSFPLKLSHQSLSQKSIRSIDPEHTSMKIKSHNEVTHISWHSYTRSEQHDVKSFVGNGKDACSAHICQSILELIVTITASGGLSR